MSERNVGTHDSTTISIPVEFGTDLPFSFKINLQLDPHMNTATITPEKPLIPGLFQIAAYAGDAKSVSALKNALALHHMPSDEITLDSERLEAVLKGIAQKRKVPARRGAASRFEKTLA